jgi:histidinol-phosphate phosphatase family protein
MSKAVFLDRDGTMTKDVPYCSRPEDLELLPTVGEGIRLLNDSGFRVIVITNQSGIARGYFTEETLWEIHQKMRNDLLRCGAKVDAIYHCPHLPDEGCECRKPKPGLVFRAARDYRVELGRAFFFGDQWHDIEAGHLAGCKTALISRSGTWEAAGGHIIEPDFIASDFLEACNWAVEFEG